MALYMPMQPSSKTPMMALSRRNCAGQARADCFSVRPGSCELGRAGGRGWRRARPAARPSHARRPAQKVLVGEVLAPERAVAARPALVSEPLRFSMPTRPGHSPLQFATVRIGPRCVMRPAKHVVAVLPDRFDHDERRVRRNLAEHLHAVLLAVDEPVAASPGRRDARAAPHVPRAGSRP